jgi:hypothetical protein
MVFVDPILDTKIVSLPVKETSPVKEIVVSPIPIEYTRFLACTFPATVSFAVLMGVYVPIPTVPPKGANRT